MTFEPAKTWNKATLYTRWGYGRNGKRPCHEARVILSGRVDGTEDGTDTIAFGGAVGLAKAYLNRCHAAGMLINEVGR